MASKRKQQDLDLPNSIVTLQQQIGTLSTKLSEREAEIVALKNKLAKAEAARDKFNADFTEATKWSGFWREKYHVAIKRKGNSNTNTNNGEAPEKTGTYAERVEAAKAEAKRTGKPATV